MNKKMMKKMTLTAVCLLLFLAMVPALHTKAARVKKAGCYCTGVINNFDSTDAMIKKVKISGNKLTTYGNYYYEKKGSSWQFNYDKKYSTLKTQKRTFYISSKCKFYTVDSLHGIKKCSKKKACKLIKACKKDYMNDLYMVVKKGKVQKIVLREACG